ncbi:MAG: class I SAM-dependent methyltransferase [Candidatus Paceibacterota bacterium]
MKIIEAYNNKLSEVYDEATSNGKWSAPNEARKILLDHKLIKSNLVILDLGIGTGQTIKPFVKKNCKIFGVDISEKMLGIVKNKYPEVEIFKYDFSNGLGGLNFQDQNFDIIISVGVLEFIKNIKKIIKETYQLLKDGGYFIFTYEMLLEDNKFQSLKVQDNSMDYKESSLKIEKFKLYRRSREEIAEMLKEAGYGIVKHSKITAYLKGQDKVPVYYGVVLIKK